MPSADDLTYLPSPEERDLEEALRLADKALEPSPADKALAAALGWLAKPRRASNACLICSQTTPNAGPFCSACMTIYGNSRDGVRR